MGTRDGAMRCFGFNSSEWEVGDGRFVCSVAGGGCVVDIPPQRAHVSTTQAGYSPLMLSEMGRRASPIDECPNVL